MKLLNRFVVVCVAYIAVACCAFSSTALSGDPSWTDSLEDSDRPILALWRSTEHRRRSEAPYLRFAIWADGRVLYANDPDTWGHDLLHGTISATRIQRIKRALADTGVLSLAGTCYLVPSAPKDCVMVDLGEKQQMLYWDERESASYGININPKPQHLAFKRCWKSINYIGLLVLPENGERLLRRVEIPDSWYIKPAVQSE